MAAAAGQPPRLASRRPNLFSFSPSPANPTGLAYEATGKLAPVTRRRRCSGRTNSPPRRQPLLRSNNSRPRRQPPQQQRRLTKQPLRRLSQQPPASSARSARTSIATTIACEPSVTVFRRCNSSWPNHRRRLHFSIADQAATNLFYFSSPEVMTGEVLIGNLSDIG
ncbi:uncharacterized protein LOC124899744 [Capsicum annuum]|uniref:uncharacterized protein LOC124899744 n=1 Tax=Capsicum annuum TaxID=4072 RepID=UPI001FB1794C|nr:uncharacterized protein LOC124899744 [Capsicum annuum]